MTVTVAHLGPNDEANLAANTPGDSGVYDEGDDESFTDPIDEPEEAPDVEDDE